MRYLSGGPSVGMVAQDPLTQSVSDVQNSFATPPQPSGEKQMLPVPPPVAQHEDPVGQSLAESHAYLSPTHADAAKQPHFPPESLQQTSGLVQSLPPSQPNVTPKVSASGIASDVSLSETSATSIVVSLAVLSTKTSLTWESAASEGEGARPTE